MSRRVSSTRRLDEPGAKTMAGELVPLVLLPRYTTYAGKITTPAIQYFTTIAMDVTQYETAIVNVWRGNMIGSTPSFTIWFEESTDQVTFSACTGSNPSGDAVSEDSETQFTLTLKKRWFRIKVLLGAANNVASCWAVGFLEERLR
jgi:hypothetical protein